MGTVRGGSGLLPFSSILPKIILPLAVCSTLVTRDFDGAADHLAGVIDHDHGAVVEIADALVVFLAFFQDEHGHALAGQHDRLERVGKVVDVEHLT